MSLTTSEFALIALSPVVTLAAIKSPELRKIAWAALMVFLAIWAMWDAVNIVSS